MKSTRQIVSQVLLDCVKHGFLCLAGLGLFIGAISQLVGKECNGVLLALCVIGIATISLLCDIRRALRDIGDRLPPRKE